MTIVRFTVDVAQFKHAAALAKLVRGGGHSMPVLEQLRLTSDGATLSIEATDLHLYMQTRLQCDAPAGFGAVDIRQVNAALKGAAKNGALQLGWNSGGLLVGSALLNAGAPAEDYPVAPTVVTAEGTVIDRQAMLDALRQVEHAIGDDETRPGQMAVYLDVDKVVATNGHRLALTKLPAAIGKSQLLPVQFVRALIAICKASKASTLVLHIDKTHVHAELDSTRISHVKGDEQFPPYAKVIPKRSKQPVHLDVERKTFIALLERVSVCVNKHSGAVTLAVLPERMQVSATSDLGSADESMPAVTHGTPNEHGMLAQAAFNVRYLLDALRAAKGEHTRIWLGAGPLDPMIIDGESDFVALVMPMCP